ncbi:MAG: hypothetical protein IT539_01365 [Bradyrhizobiaceae bacterium]|nr:hypothetical protein [Bradyrhizobiaceae bacterium]
MTRTAPLFTDRDVELARRCIQFPESFNVTAPELKACLAVVDHCVGGSEVGEEEAMLARRLFDAIGRLIDQ